MCFDKIGGQKEPKKRRMDFVKDLYFNKYDVLCGSNNIHISKCLFYYL